MKAEQHWEYPVELQRLHSTTKAIDEAIQKNEQENERRLQTTGADEWSTYRLRAFFADHRWPSRDPRSSPYFGRIDLASDEQPCEQLYIGHEGLDLGEWQVIDWRAPVARLFYSGTAAQQSYLAPEGTISGHLLLKRRFRIENGKLLDIADEVDRRGRSADTSTLVSEEVYLGDALAGRGTMQLQDIVRTIQREQDALIRAPHNKALVINGVAGSGKTTIGFHRLAYLLYPDANINIQPQRVIVFGPNRLFLTYVSDLLPKLGIRNIHQTTFEEWALKRMGLEGKANVVESSLALFLDHDSPRERRVVLWRRARLKGSRQMEALLEAFVEWQKQQFTIPPDGLVFSKLGDTNVTLRMSASEMRSIVTRSLAPGRPLEKARRETRSDLIRTLRRKLHKNHWKTDWELAQSQDRRARDIHFQRRILRDLEQRVGRDFAVWWPEVRPVEDYYGLLSDRQRLNEIGNMILSKENVDLLTSMSVPPPRTIEREDLPALYYYFLLLNGRPAQDKNAPVYDHIVVDEAQDFSALQFKTLRMHSRDGSMTILGDIAQGIYAYRGITSWDELRRAFQEHELQYEEVVQSYRSTKEIVEFANEVLKQVRGSRAVLAKLFNRSGPRPKVTGCESEHSMMSKVEGELRDLISRGLRTIAVISKTDSDCERIGGHLAKRGLSVAVITSVEEAGTDDRHAGEVVVLPVALAKGMEFEAVLVLDANSQTYDGTVEYDGRLLYVAVTRALHSLSVYSVGPVSSFLESAKTKATVVRA